MSREAINALRDIVAICDGSMNITARQTQIFDLALQGLGLVESQRKAAMGKWHYNRLMNIRAARAEREMKRKAAAMQEAA